MHFFSQSSYQYGYDSKEILPPACKAIIIINIIAFFIKEIFGNYILFYFSLHSLHSPFFHIWQPLTYMFLHADFFHILLNMIALWMFGGMLEERLGKNVFLKIYFISGILSGLTQATIPDNFRIIGASGATYGLLASFAYFWPNISVFLMGIFPVKSKNLVILLALVGVFYTIKPGSEGNIAHLIHLLGGIIALIYLQLTYRKYPFFSTFFKEKFSSFSHLFKNGKKEKKTSHYVVKRLDDDQ